MRERNGWDGTFSFPSWCVFKETAWDVDAATRFCVHEPVVLLGLRRRAGREGGTTREVGEMVVSGQCVVELPFPCPSNGEATVRWLKCHEGCGCRVARSGARDTGNLMARCMLHSHTVVRGNAEVSTEQVFSSTREQPSESNTNQIRIPVARGARRRARINSVAAPPLRHHLWSPALHPRDHRLG